MGKRIDAPRLVRKYGSEIIKSKGMQSEKGFMQHGRISVFQHSVSVACMSMKLSSLVPGTVDNQALVRGALLHDYFLYDWHVADKSHKLHGFTHAKKAAKNADRDFHLTTLEKDMIEHHMFPLNIKPPKYKESFILCIADKICAFHETVACR